MKIQGVTDDRIFIEDQFDRVSSKHPVQKMALIEIDDENNFMKTDGEIFEAIHEGKGKRGNDLLTKGRGIDKIPDDKIKILRERIEADLEDIDDDGGAGGKFENPFLPPIDELDD